MKLKDLFSITDQFKHIHGIENQLRQRRRNSIIATIATVLLGFFEVIRELAENNEFILAYLSKFAKYTFAFFQYLWHIITFQWGALSGYQIVYDALGIYIILLGIVIYYLYRHTSFLFKITEDPFQYTFWIARFKRAENAEENTPSIAENDQIHHLLHHDLMDMMNRRIGRFSLLDEKHFDKETEPNPTPPSHIHVDGHYTIRDRNHEDKTIQVIQVMPRIRIGPPGNPSTLTYPVEVELNNENPSENKQGHLLGDLLNQEIYNQVLEQVYSKVASEIYKQIKFDISQKIHLFPTNYLRAVALYHEADDFSRSNTLDSYDYAIELYKLALRYYDISMRSGISKWLNNLRLYRLGMEYELMYAKTKIGYAKSLIYRREISSLTGRTQNALYEIPHEINKVITRLIKIHNKFHLWKWKIVSASPRKQPTDVEKKIVKKNRLGLNASSLTYPKDTWRKRHLAWKIEISKFENLKKLLFDAYVVLSLAYSNLGAFKNAKENLENAKAAYPEKCDSNALYLLTKAEVELDLELKIPYLIQSTEMAPDFEIAQYLLARHMLSLFLSKGEIKRERATSVIKEFNKVLKINPGNIASFGYLGYLYWLIDDLNLARKQFELGIKTKTLVQQTFIGELNYGLARIAAKHGEFNNCFDLYSESLLSEPGLGVFTAVSIKGKTRTISSYDYITPEVLSRYNGFKENFENQIYAVHAKFYTKDFDSLEELQQVMKNDKFNILQYFNNEATQSITDTSAQKSVYTDTAFTDLINQLLSDRKFHAYIISKDKSWGQSINKLKKAVDFDEEDKTSIERLNRLILEHLYPKYIRESQGENYFKHFATQRQIFENNGKLISKNTLNKSYSYVLNDFGNACLNYYHRFGDTGQLDEAYSAFEKAIKLNPQNGIAYYNIANAVLWKYRNDSYNSFHIRKKYLKEADQWIAFPWPKVITEAVEYQILDIFDKLDQEKQAIRKDENRLKFLDQKIEALQKEQFKKPLKKNIYGQSGESGQVLKSINKEELSSKIDEREEIIKNLPIRKNKFKKVQREFESKFISSIKRTLELSKLTAVIEGFGMDALGEGVTKLLKLKIPPDRLDERDIEALQGWNKLLSIHETNKHTLDSCLKLSDFISTTYLPQSFDIDNILFAVYQKFEDAEIEKIFKKYSVDKIFDKNELIKIYGETESEEILNAPSGEILKREKYRFNRVKENFRSPFFKMLDITHPEVLVKKIIEICPESENKLIEDIKTKFSQQHKVVYDLKFTLTTYLNQLIKTHFDKEIFFPLENFFPRTRQLIEFELEGKLKGNDLHRFNRKILEELFPEDIERSKIEIIRERICETIKDIWLASDPVHYLSLDEWAKTFLIFPESEHFLKEAIHDDGPGVDEIHKTLSELYEKEGYEEEAIENFQKATEEYPDKIIYYFKLSKALRRKNQFDEAKEKIYEAKEKNIISISDYDAELKEILHDEAFYFKEQNEWDNAILKYEEAIRTFPKEESFEKELKRTKAAYIKHKIGNHYGKNWVDQLLVVTPIAMEVASDLIPFVEAEGSGLKSSLLDLVNNMRERILRDFGVKVPGIRFRGNEYDLTAGTYIILINEVPLVSGNIDLNKRMFTGSKATLETLKIPWEKAIAPLTGEEACWISEEHVKKLVNTSEILWEVLEYPMQHLEDVLQRNLVEFLGHQEVYNLIELNTPEKYDHYLNPKELTPLTSLLRGLVNERVPISAFRLILDYFEEYHRPGMNITELINNVRLLPEIKKDLPGNRKKGFYKKLSARMEKEFENAKYTENGKFLLAMLPENCQKVLTAVREGVSKEENVVIVVENKSLRPLVNQLLKLEFPNTPVLAREELLATIENGADLAEIDLK